MFSLRNISNRNVINVTVLRCQEGIVFLSFGNFFVKLIASVSDIVVFIFLCSEWNHKKGSDGRSGQRSDIEEGLQQEMTTYPYPPPRRQTNRQTLTGSPSRWRISTTNQTFSSWFSLPMVIEIWLLCLFWMFSCHKHLANRRFHLTRNVCHQHPTGFQQITPLRKGRKLCLTLFMMFFRWKHCL